MCKIQVTYREQKRRAINKYLLKTNYNNYDKIKRAAEKIDNMATNIFICSLIKLRK